MGALLEPIVVAGAGPAGALLATYLAREGHHVTVYESRPDLRRHEVDSGRSINLALAARGIVPLVDIGVIDRVDEITIPMRGRMVHPADGVPSELQPYGSKPFEVIHSVSRTDLNAILLDAADATGLVEFRFDTQISEVDLERSRLVLADGSTEPFGVLFGADGAGSRVREALSESGACHQHTDWLPHSYKELTLQPHPDGGHRLDPHALHIWPRGELMLIALANPAGDFTVTLFAPNETFEALTEPAAVQTFFANEFTDFAVMMPDLVEQFFSNPTGRLGTVRATGWSYRDRAVLVGDAAHAIVPFHGQGMNAAMESARVLAACLAGAPDDVTGAFQRYEALRKPNTDAIADMALENYVEMRSGVIDPQYLARRELELALERQFPDSVSPHYAMVMFSTMPYAEARERTRRQDEVIATILEDPSADREALIARLEPLPALDPRFVDCGLSVE